MAEQSKQTPVAAILGVGPGLGAALARRFAKGYAVAVVARRADYLKSVCDGIRASGGRSLEVVADVGDSGQLAAAFKSIREQLGSPEVLIYNASAGPFGSLSEISAEEYENSWRVSAFGAFLSAKEVVPEMLTRGHGRQRLVRRSSRSAGSLNRWRAIWVPRESTSHRSMSTDRSTSRAASAALNRRTRTC